MGVLPCEKIQAEVGFDAFLPYIFADVMSGKNSFGGGGPGIGIHFTPAIDILTGPIFFFDKTLQPPFAPNTGSSMMWTVQLDVDIDLGQSDNN